MNPDRIEVLLGRRPPDEPEYAVELALEPVATNRVGAARSSGRPMPANILRWATLAVVAGLGVTLGAFTLGSRLAAPMVTSSTTGTAAALPAPSTPLGVIPWLDASPAPAPTPEPTVAPTALPLCVPDDLALVTEGWGGATASAAGGVTIVNVSGNPCHLEKPLAIELDDAMGRAIAHSGPSVNGYSANENLVGLPAGGSAGAIVVWDNWCASPPPVPETLKVTLAAGTPGTTSTSTLTARVRISLATLVPRCDDPAAGSSIATLPFAAPEPSGGAYTPESCAPQDLDAFSGPWGASGGSSYVDLVVLNRGNLDCTFQASPTVRLFDANGTLVVLAGPPRPGQSSTFLLAPGWSASASLAFADWCIGHPALPFHMAIDVGPGKVAVSPVRDPNASIPVPGCMSQPGTTPPSFNLVSPFATPGTPEPPGPDLGDYIPLQVAISPLSTAAPGTELVYDVTLTNVSAYDKPINLAAGCPDYTESLLMSGNATQKRTLILNCGPAGILAAGSSVTFEMHLAIPATAPTGAAALVWELGRMGPAAKSTLTIAP